MLPLGVSRDHKQAKAQVLLPHFYRDMSHKVCDQAVALHRVQDCSRTRRSGLCVWFNDAWCPNAVEMDGHMMMQT